MSDKQKTAQQGSQSQRVGSPHHRMQPQKTSPQSGSAKQEPHHQAPSSTSSPSQSSPAHKPSKAEQHTKSSLRQSSPNRSQSNQSSQGHRVLKHETLNKGSRTQSSPHPNRSSTPTQGSPRHEPQPVSSPQHEYQTSHDFPHSGTPSNGSPAHSCPGSPDNSDDEVELTEAEIWEKEKQELKAKLSELEEFKGKYENEKKENQILQNRLSDLMAGQSDATQRLMRTSDSLDRLKLDHTKKVEQIEKMQRDISFKDDRIRNLEIRASEVEKAELILETTKNNLEATVAQVRTREGEIRKLNKDIDDLNRQLELANSVNKELESRVEDLKIQVRHELMKNDNIEKNLETIPRLKDTILEKEDQIQNQQKQLEEKTALLSAARRAVREYKDSLRSLEREISKTEELKYDLDISQCEVMTLKKLMYGKDYLVSQKSKALDLSKEIIEVMNDSLDNDHVHRIQQLLDRVATPTLKTRLSSSSSSSFRNGSFSSPSDSAESRPQSTPTKTRRCITPGPGHHREISVNDYPYSIDDSQKHNNKDKHVFLNKMILEIPGKRKRPVSAVHPSSRPKSSFRRTSSLKEACKVYTQPQPRKNNMYDIELEHVPNSYKSDKDPNMKNKPSLDYNIGAYDDVDGGERTPHSSTPRDSARDSEVQDQHFSDSDSNHSGDTDYEEELTVDQENLLRSYTAKQKDQFLSDIINVGDRVLFKRAQKPPKYGKKKAPKPLIHTGIVKFKGKFDEDKYDARVQVGVRLDEPVGDTDGMVMGKRYMYTPGDQGKFYKLREITSILNVKSGRYVPMRKVLFHHIHRLQMTKSHHRQAVEAH